MSEIRVDRIRSESGSGAVDFPSGVTIAGVITATVLNQTVVGVTTFNNANFSNGFSVSGVITSTSFQGDGSLLTGVNLGISTIGGVLGYGVSTIDFRGSGISTTTIDNTLGIATINIEGGGGGLNAINFILSI